ncbi:hypothetical protein QUF72_10425 [Desulfobacterales bacterium HSG2]|nr:hypothetical protein [Desulfobacterales bacterium HSG2]
MNVIARRFEDWLREKADHNRNGKPSDAGKKYLRSVLREMTGALKAFGGRSSCHPLDMPLC